MKRLLAMFLAVVMLVTNCPVTAFATDTEILESGNFRYQILSDVYRIDVITGIVEFHFGGDAFCSVDRACFHYICNSRAQGRTG